MAEALNAEVAEISGTVERITYKNQNKLEIIDGQQ